MVFFVLNERLKELNISQTKFAKQTNVRPNTINDMCNNVTKRIEVTTINKILMGLNKLGDREYSITDIIKYENE
ncbi:helix-turn-helix domain-containing protein [Carnobacterium divergens]